jgi:hypothetical protein
MARAGPFLQVFREMADGKSLQHSDLEPLKEELEIIYDELLALEVGWGERSWLCIET